MMVIYLYIKGTDDKNTNDVIIFLKSINSIKEIDGNILNNGVGLYQDDGEICGYITYEDFIEYGLIRYFIFQKTIDFEYVKKMFNELIIKAKVNNIEAFISIGNNFDVVNLFKELMFETIDFDDFIINDRLLYGTEFEYATILKYNI